MSSWICRPRLVTLVNWGIDVLERVQKRAVNLVVGLVGRTYEEKLTELGLNTLKDRRIQIDLVQTFKILKGIDRVDSDTWFNIVGDNITRLTRNTAYEGNLLAYRSNTNLSKNFFTNRVIPLWNALPTKLKTREMSRYLKQDLRKLHLKCARNSVAENVAFQDDS